MTPKDMSNLEILRNVLSAEGKTIKKVSTGFTVHNEDGEIICRTQTVDALCLHYNDAFSKYDLSSMGIKPATKTDTKGGVPSPTLFNALQGLTEDDWVCILEALHLNSEDASPKVAAVFNACSEFFLTAHSRMQSREQTREKIRAKLRGAAVPVLVEPAAKYRPASKARIKKPQDKVLIQRQFRNDRTTIQSEILDVLRTATKPMLSEEIIKHVTCTKNKDSIMSILTKLRRQGYLIQQGQSGNHNRPSTIAYSLA